jgi:hypothetical protein
MEGFSFVTPVTDLSRPNTGNEDDDDDDDVTSETSELISRETNRFAQQFL